MLAFVDVSGDPYDKPERSPWVAVHIICIRKRAVYDMTAAFYRYKKEILLNEYIELKSTDLINKSTLNHQNLEKVRFLQATIENCIDHVDCMHAGIIFRNTGANKKSDDNRLPKHYIDALWRIEVIAREWKAKDIVVVIDNNARKTDKHLAFAFNNYIYRSSGGSQLQRILPVPIFADSETTAGLQLADISAGIMRNYYLHELNTVKEVDSVFHQKLVEYHTVIKARSIDRRIGSYSVNGIYCPPNEYFL